MENKLITEKRKGLICVALSAFLYSLGGLCIKLVPWSGISVNAGRNIIAIVVIGIYLMVTKHKLRINRWILLGSACVSGTNILFCLANKMTTAANAIVLQFTAPIFVIVLGILFWKRKPDKLDVIACLLVLVGVVFCFLDGLEMGGMLGNALALISGLTYAGVFLLNDLPDADPICSVFWGDCFSVLVGLPFLLQETDFGPTAMLNIFILGVFQTGFAYICMCIGLRTVPAVAASLISGFEPILNPVIVAIFYHEPMGRMALVGAVIVIGSVLGYNILKSKREKQLPAENKG